MSTPSIRTLRRIAIKNSGLKVKVKTKSASKKRFTLTATGEVRAGGAFHRHNTGKYSSKQKRRQRGTVVLARNVSRIIRKYHHLTD